MSERVLQLQVQSRTQLLTCFWHRSCSMDWEIAGGC